MDGNAKPSSSRPAKQVDMLIKLWKKSGFRFGMIMLSAKGALPATIALAAYQTPAWSRVYTTLGYFVAIIAMLSMAMQPRAKFFQSIFTNAIFVSTAAAANLLMILCAVTARNPANKQSLHGGSSSSLEATPYDSSANAVAAVWLFFIVFGTNYLRVKRPQLAVPAIQFNIYSITAATYSPSFPDVAAGLDFTLRLLIAFLTSYALAAAVNVLIWPTTSREKVKMQSAELISALKDCTKSYKDYADSFDKSTETEDGSKDPADLVKKLRDKSQEISDHFGKIKLELDFARKEVAYGKLAPDHLRELYIGMREVLQPILGLSTFLQIVTDAQQNNAGFDSNGSSQILEAIRELKADEWSTIMVTFRDSHAQLQEVMSQALDHISEQLQLVSRWKIKQSDVEHSTEPRPGHSSFAAHLEQELCQYQTRHDQLIQAWLAQDQANFRNRHQTVRTTSDESDINSSSTQMNTDPKPDPKQRRSYVILYLSSLLYNAGQAVLRQVRFADGLVADGTMSRRRFIFPGRRPVGQLMMGAFIDVDQDESMGVNANNGHNIWVGDLSKSKKDPEHMSPTNAYEKFTDCLRRIPRSLSSSHASFGLRSAVATLSVALAGFLSRSRPFFLDQRGIWAASMTALAMTPQFGASVSGFAMRILGTAVAAAISISITYIADHKVAGIIVLFYFQAVGWFLLISRFPSFELTGIIGSAAVIIIVGYQLQVDVIGIAASAADGQVYYPVYFLALYRLVAIIAGLAVAFFWSFFPFPVTSHGSLRQDTANTIYILANYHSCVYATLDIYSRFGSDAHKLPDDHPVNRLEEARQEVFGKSILMLGRLREHLHASRFEPRFGGKFPRDQYEQVIKSLSYIFTYLALMTYSSKAFIRDSEHTCATDKTTKASDVEDKRQVLEKFHVSMSGAQLTSHKLTSTLCLLAASVHSGQPLPPYLSASRHHDPAEKLTEVAPDMSDALQLMHPYDAALMINKITASLLNGEIGKLTELIKGLVGEIDFSFHIMSTSDDSMSTLVNTYSNHMDANAWTESTKVKAS